MEIIKLKYDAVKQALETLDIAIKRVDSIDHTTEGANCEIKHMIP